MLKFLLYLLSKTSKSFSSVVSERPQCHSILLQCQKESDLGTACLPVPAGMNSKHCLAFQWVPGRSVQDLH